MNMGTARPSRIHKVDEHTLGIDWSDGINAKYPVRLLRQRCPCAACVDEMTGQRTLDPGAVPEDIKPVDISPVGRYAFHIQWSDGHDTGIYSYELLREILFEILQAEGNA